MLFWVKNYVFWATFVCYYWWKGVPPKFKKKRCNGFPILPLGSSPQREYQHHWKWGFWKLDISVKDNMFSTEKTFTKKWLAEKSLELCLLLFLETISNTNIFIDWRKKLKKYNKTYLIITPVLSMWRPPREC